MPKGTPKESGINKNPPTNPYNIDNRLCIKIELNEKERTYFERLASVMSKVQLGKDKSYYLIRPYHL
jgi:hypothetical protein